jgi:hypothetical protein
LGMWVKKHNSWSSNSSSQFVSKISIL